MKTTLITAVLVLVLGAAIPLRAATLSSNGVQVPIPITAKAVPGPVSGNTMTPAYVQLVGRMAYVSI